MERFMLAVVFSAVLLVRSAALADGVGIQPTKIQIDAAHRIATITIANNDPVTHTFQITPFLWNQVNGLDKLTDTTDLLVSPPIFTLIAGGTQSVRFALRNPAPVAGELTYRVLLRTAPTDVVPVSSGAQMRVGFSLPVFIASPQGGESKLAYHYRDLGHDHVQLNVENTGLAHAKILHVRLSDGHGMAVDAPESEYVLAGGKATLDLTPSRAIVGDTVSAKITFDVGPPIEVVLRRDG